MSDDVYENDPDDDIAYEELVNEQWYEQEEYMDPNSLYDEGYRDASEEDRKVD